MTASRTALVATASTFSHCRRLAASWNRPSVATARSMASPVSRLLGKLIRPRPTISFIRHRCVMPPSASAWAITMCRLLDPTSMAATRNSVRSAAAGRRAAAGRGLSVDMGDSLVDGGT